MTLRDFGAEGLAENQQLEAVRAFAPDMIGLSARSFFYPATVRLAENLKRLLPEVPIIMGGQHVTLLGADHSWPDCFDCVVFGEGEEACARLFAAVQRGESLPRKMRGAALGEISHVPAWDILASAKNYRRAYTPFFTDAIGSVVWSRGCPFNCFFCSGPAIWAGCKPRVRYRTPASVGAEMELLSSRFGVRRVFVHDDTLNANLEKLRAILEELRRRHTSVIWGAAGMRANQALTPEWLFPLLWNAGCRYVSFGIESGSPQVLQKLNRRVTHEETERALALAARCGFKTCGGFTIGHVWPGPDGGLEGEHEKDLITTLDYMRSLLRRRLLWSIQMSVITPLPGSPLFAAVTAQNLQLSDDLEQIGACDRVRLTFKHPHLTPAQVNSYYQKAYRLVSLSPRHIWHLISQVKDVDDLRGLLRTGFFIMRNRISLGTAAGG
jgi:radical SAM superfamily enzyme YgiQ (UPF0313 family)